MNTKLRNKLIAVGLLAGALSLAVAPLFPPSPRGLDSPQSEFSAIRAAKHVQAIAQAPHPTGSRANDEVCDYISRQLTLLGLSPAVQKANVEVKRGDAPPVNVSVANVAATIKGTTPVKSVLLVAHYDSTPESPGASDNGSGVATLLETGRALLEGLPLTRNVVLLFTDGEERGLSGARAFVSENSLASSFDTVLNFDARGSTGPVVMFEAAGPLSLLIPDFGRDAPYPIATSVSNDIYRKMPNRTDFSVFREKNYAGLNFAFFAEPQHYHNAYDSIENLDLRSLQQEGSYAVALARQLGNPNSDSNGGEVYFNLGPWILVRYPESWTTIFVGFSALLWLAVFAVEMFRRHITIPGLMAGTFALALSLGISLFCGFCLSRWFGDLVDAHEGGATIAIVCLGFEIALCLLIISTVYHWLSRGRRPLEVLLPIYGLWLTGSILGAIYLPGGSYLFVWPTMLGMIALATITILTRNASPTDGERLWLSVAILPALIVFVPALSLINFAMRSWMVTMATLLLLMLVVSLLAPLLMTLVQGERFWRVQGCVAAFTAVLLVLAIALSHQPNNSSARISSPHEELSQNATA